ncbi:MAG: signal recognition particle-docking protein FtsY, partial [Atribacterota bacterium]
DPGAVVFDGIDAAHKRGSTVAIVDTAGRSHVNKNLLAELEKVGKIIMRLVPAENVENILVIDAMAGQNAFIQAESMGKAVPITGVILTKWDSQAKGGIVFRIRQELGFPLKYIGIGEKIEDVMLFDNKQFVQAVVYGEEFS